MNYAVELQQVVKNYGTHSVLQGLNLTLEQGKVSALLGPNGAGKTTTVSLILHLLKPTSGDIKVLGLNPGSPELRQQVGALLQEVKPADGLKVREILQLFRSYYRNPLSLERLLDISGLHKQAAQKATTLSGGQRRRLAFAQCLAGNPNLIILDEPTAGMDIESRLRFWEVIRALASDGTTILLTTHYLEEADALADSISVIAEGKLVASGTPQSLKASVSLRTISMCISEPPAQGVLKALPGVEQVEINGTLVRLYARETDHLLPVLLSSGWGVRDVQVHSASLETVFRRLTASPLPNERESLS